MAEVPDAELAQYKAAAALLAKMNKDPSARKNLEAALKIVNPEVETEEDVAARIAKPYVEKLEAVQNEFKEFKSQFETEKQTAAEQQAEADTQAAFDRLAAAGYTEDGIGKIKALMVDRKIADPEAAAALFDRLNPPPAAEQPGWVPTAWSLDSTAPQGADPKLLFQDEERWADQEVSNVLRDIRSRG